MSREARAIGAIVCMQGCCAGCQDCYGMSIGCHQEPCRCSLPCTCRWKDEDADPSWQVGCERHDTTADQRKYAEVDFVEYDEDLDSEALSPCPECGALGACSYDDEGRALIHTITANEEDQ